MVPLPSVASLRGICVILYSTITLSSFYGTTHYPARSVESNPQAEIEETENKEDREKNVKKISLQVSIDVSSPASRYGHRHHIIVYLRHDIGDIHRHRFAAPGLFCFGGGREVHDPTMGTTVFTATNRTPVLRARLCSLL